MRTLTILLLLCFSSCATKPQIPIIAEDMMTITEMNPNKWTALTRQNLEHLVQVYHLKPIFFTNKIFIESKVTPHSYPVLTLNTRFAEQPNKLLSVFVHEQLHWWSNKKKVEMKKAMLEVKKVFPVLPEERIAKDGHSTYLHLIICFLEYQTMIHYLEKKEADKILTDFIKKDKIYPWINTQVYLKYKKLDEIVRKYKLSPLPGPDQKPTKKPPLSTASELKNLYRSLVLSLVISEPTPMQLI